MGTTNTDRIEKKILLKASRARVWRALTNAEEFGSWFGVKLQGPIRLGSKLQGKVTQPGYEHIPFELSVERMDSERLFSWRWHHLDENKKVDMDGPTTHVVFELEDAQGGTLLKVVESGFDQLPLRYREKSYWTNDEGWTIQMGNIEKHVNKAA